MYPSRPPASLFPCGQVRPRFTSRPLKTAPSELKHFARRAGPPSTRMRPMPMLSAMAFASGASSNGASCRLDSRNGVNPRWDGAWISRVYRSEIASEALPWRLENITFDFAKISSTVNGVTTWLNIPLGLREFAARSTASDLRSCNESARRVPPVCIAHCPRGRGSTVTCGSGAMLFLLRQTLRLARVRPARRRRHARWIQIFRAIRRATR